MTKNMKAVLTACKDKDCETLIRQGLEKSRYSVLRSISVNTDLFAAVKEHEPDALVLQVDIPNKTLLNSLKSIYDGYAIPIVMFATEARGYMVEEVVEAGVSAFVVDGLSQNRVRPILDTAVARFNSVKNIRDELHKTKLSLIERKYIDRAKGLLIKQKQISEDEAYQMLRKMAMENNKRIGQAAKDVVSVLEVLV